MRDVDLHVPCTTGPKGSGLEINAYDTETELCVTTRDGGDVTTVWIDKDNIREIFNFLGVWLHRN